MKDTYVIVLSILFFYNILKWLIPGLSVLNILSYFSIRPEMVGFGELKLLRPPIESEVRERLITGYVSSLFDESIQPIKLLVDNQKELKPREGYFEVSGQNQLSCFNSAFYPIDRTEQYITFTSGFLHYNTDKDGQIRKRPEIYFIKGQFLTGFFGSNTIPFEVYLNAVPSPFNNTNFEMKINANQTQGLLIVESIYDYFTTNASLTINFEEIMPFIENRSAYIISNFNFEMNAVSRVNDEVNFDTLDDGINKKKEYVSLLRACIISASPMRDIDRQINIQYNLRPQGFELNENISEKSKACLYISKVINFPYRSILFCVCIIECIIIMNCPTHSWTAYIIVNICRIVSLMKVTYEFSFVIQSFEGLLPIKIFQNNQKKYLSSIILVIIYQLCKHNIDHIMYLLLVKYLGYLYIIRNSNWIVLAVTNSLNKNRYCPGFFMGLFTWMSMNFIFIYTSWYNLMGIEIENISILNGIVIQIVSGILLSIQYYYGSRFFLPKRYRSYAYNYERIISDDFDISKTPEENWPECDFCLTKLQRRDINADEFKDKYTTNRSNGKYMKSPDGHKFHEDCLRLYVLKKYNELGYQKYAPIENFDD